MLRDSRTACGSRGKVSTQNRRMETGFLSMLGGNSHSHGKRQLEWPPQLEKTTSGGSSENTLVQFSSPRYVIFRLFGFFFFSFFQCGCQSSVLRTPIPRHRQDKTDRQRVKCVNTNGLSLSHTHSHAHIDTHMHA